MLYNYFLYKDNESAINMEKNRRNSCIGNSRHISIKYFVVKDRVDKEEFSIEYCTTLEMLTDFFIKLLQGSPFDVSGKALWDGCMSTS